MSASILLALAALVAAAPLRPLDAEGIDGPLLGLAFVGADELVALSPEAVTLHRLSGSRLRPIARREVASAGPRARRPGGLLRAAPVERRVWALASGWGAALLLDPDDGLAVRGEAEALPWPGSARGVRIRPGTSLLEADLPGLGSGPFLALAPGHALDGRGRLLRSDGDPLDLALGIPLAALADGRLLAGSAAPPGEPDALLLIEEGLVSVLRDDLPGSLRGLAARPLPHGSWRCVLGLESRDGTRLFELDLAPGDLRGEARVTP